MKLASPPWTTRLTIRSLRSLGCVIAAGTSAPPLHALYRVEAAPHRDARGEANGAVVEVDDHAERAARGVHHGVHAGHARAGRSPDAGLQGHRLPRTHFVQPLLGQE